MNIHNDPLSDSFGRNGRDRAHSNHSVEQSVDDWNDVDPPKPRLEPLQVLPNDQLGRAQGAHNSLGSQ